MVANVFLAGYSWRKGARLNADANAVVHELEALRQVRKDGKVTIDEVITHAQSPQSAMHALYEWDESKAAWEHWRETTRYTLRSIIPVYADPATEDEMPVERRVYVAEYTNTNDRDDAGIYRAVPVIYKESEPEPAVEPVSPRVTRGLDVLRRWADSYRDEPYFARVVAAIDDLG